jgi:3-oxoacyl-[acyl-carrier protein] reductase
VVLVARNADTLKPVVENIRSSGGMADFHACDVGDGEALTGVIEQVANTLGRLDILVNNAGMTRDMLLLRMTDEDFDNVIRVNLKSVFVACRAAARPMLRQRFGRIVNVGSVTGVWGNSGQSNYAAAKSALHGFTASLAKELGPKGITANVVAPGFIDTEMTKSIGEDMRKEAQKVIPLRRFGQPVEVAQAIAWICSDEASYYSGQVMIVDGGLVC